MPTATAPLLSLDEVDAELVAVQYVVQHELVDLAAVSTWADKLRHRWAAGPWERALLDHYASGIVKCAHQPRSLAPAAAVLECLELARHEVARVRTPRRTYRDVDDLARGHGAGGSLIWDYDYDWLLRLKDKAESCASIALMQILLSEALDTLSQIASDPAGAHSSRMGTALDALHRLQKSESLLDDPTWWPASEA
ncbi:hypothetical protein ACFCV3_32045 [Kribbella sp. NPDC056345]|uniref:hypothetical protein n=1 Tax=Kribbella sp. NPDC056345 TaxID=3345789 RepID=UPI0035E3A8CB